MWHKIVGFIQFCYGDLPQTLESNSYSRATTPEQIVAAAVFESMAKNFEDWELCQRSTNYSKFRKSDPQYLYQKYDQELHPKNVNSYKYSSHEIVFRNKKKNLDAVLTAGISPKMGVVYDYSGLSVDDIELSEIDRNRIIALWSKKHNALLAVERAAAKALADMERNEKAWNLAEKLLNMKRNENGALVPVVDVNALPEHKKTTDNQLVEIMETPFRTRGL